MLPGSLAFFAGCLHIWVATTFPFFLIVCSAILALVLGACRYKIRWLVLFVLGLCWPYVYQYAISNSHIFDSLNKDATIWAQVVDFPQSKGKHQTLLLAVQAIDGQSTGYFILPKVRVNWYQLDIRPQLGEHWELRVRLKAPRGLSNAHGFDYERWLFAQKIQATGYVVGKSKGNRLMDSGVLSLHGIRRWIHQRQSTQPTIDYRDYISALTLGVKSEVFNQSQDLFVRTGTAHLFAISGLHIGIITFAAYWLLLYLSRLFFLIVPLPSLPLQKIAMFGALLVCILYSLLAGLTLPTQRALVMMALVAANTLFRLSLSPRSGFCLALAGVLVLNPYQLLTAGFWLSFGAIWIILLVVDTCPGHRWKQLILVQIKLSMGMLPITLMVFGKVSGLSWLFNLLLIPVFSFCIVPLALITTLLLCFDNIGGVLLGEVFDGILGVVIISMQWANEHLGWSMVGEALRPLLVVIIALVVMCLLPPIMPRWCWGAILLLVVPFAQVRRESNDVLLMTVFDVGHGLAVLLEHNNKQLLYDTGFRNPSGFNASDAILMPYFNHYGIESIDTLVISHRDNDHYGGFEYLKEKVGIEQLWFGEPGDYGMPATSCQKNKRILWHGILIEMFQVVDSYRKKSNDYSCVLRLQYGKNSILLTGDLEAYGEKRLLSASADIASDVLIVPHHGSATSSSWEFVDAVGPRFAIFSTGYRNRYRLPHTKVLKRYVEKGTKILRTDVDGQVVLKFSRDTKDIIIVRHRLDNARLWRRSHP